MTKKRDRHRARKEPGSERRSRAEKKAKQFAGKPRSEGDQARPFERKKKFSDRFESRDRDRPKDRDRGGSHDRPRDRNFEDRKRDQKSGEEKKHSGRPFFGGRDRKDRDQKSPEELGRMSAHEDRESFRKRFKERYKPGAGSSGEKIEQRQGPDDRRGPRPDRRRAEEPRRSDGRPPFRNDEQRRPSFRKPDFKKPGFRGGPRDRKRFNDDDSYPDHGVIIHGEIQKNARGFAFLLHKPEDYFIPQFMAKPLIHGDHVRAWVDPKTREVLKVEVSKRTLKQFVGTYNSNLGNRIVTLEEKNLRQDVVIRERPEIIGLRNGDKVLCEVTTYEPQLEGKILRSFGPKLAPNLDTFSVVVRSSWPQEFSPEAIKDAETLSERITKEEEEKGYPGRKDLRSKPFVTIDGKDARDFDDAILVEKTDSGYVLYVAIADVAEFLRPGTKLDQEAYARATSVYFPEWVIPMLPEALSNGACSLRPDEDKLTLTCEMHFDFEGKKRTSKVYESVIRSHRRCIYEDVQVEYEQGKEFWKEPYELFRKLRQRRFKRGALDLDLPEAKIVLDEQGDAVDIKRLDRVDAHKVIEEFMIIANESVTEIMQREGWPFIYRVHEPPKAESLERFERFAAALGLRPNIGNGNDPLLISRFIDSIRDKPFATTLHYLLLRSLKQARYESVNLFHFGLASRAYTHFTSPIRRYPDTMVHRILKRFIRHQPYENDKIIDFENYLVDACEHCSKNERKAEELDRKVIKMKKARFMEKKLGESFDARITNVSESGVFVELEQWFIEGMVGIDDLGHDYFEYVEEKLMLKGKRSGAKYRIGDSIRVQLTRVDIESGLIDFILEDEDGDNSNKYPGDSDS